MRATGPLASLVLVLALLLAPSAAAHTSDGHGHELFGSFSLLEVYEAAGQATWETTLDRAGAAPGDNATLDELATVHPLAASLLLAPQIGNITAEEVIATGGPALNALSTVPEEPTLDQSLGMVHAGLLQQLSAELAIDGRAQEGYVLATFAATVAMAEDNLDQGPALSVGRAYQELASRGGTADEDNLYRDVMAWASDRHEGAVLPGPGWLVEELDEVADQGIDLDDDIAGHVGAASVILRESAETDLTPAYLFTGITGALFAIVVIWARGHQPHKTGEE